VRGNVNMLSLVVAKNTQDLRNSNKDYTTFATQVSDLSNQVKTIKTSTTDASDALAKVDALAPKVDALASQFQTLSSQISVMDARPAAVATVSAPATVDLTPTNNRITALETELVNIQNKSALPSARLSTMNAAGDFLTIEPNSIMRKVGASFNIGQATDISGSGIVSTDVTISGQPDLWHALAFGGTANDPIYSSMIAERKVAGGQSELLLAKFKDFDNGQGPDQIRHFAPRHVFATFPDGMATLSASADAQSTFKTIDANNKVMMQIEPSGVTIGNHKLVSAGDTLNVCTADGNNCKKVY
jgi:outer membrane murein-binding lipoprotein Lpp